MRRFNQFLEIDPRYHTYEKAKFVIVPCPEEKTTTYGKGTKHGPMAILNASKEVETFDEDLQCEPYRKGGIHTIRPISVKSLESRVASLLNENKIPVVLGGEHSITPVAVKAFAKKHKDLSVLQLDAHADLRDSYHGSKNSHACAMRRTLESCPVVQAGIRNIAAEEWEWAGKNGQLSKIYFAHKMPKADQIGAQLSPHVYITIDVDVFDPSLIPATGTPEPGGLFWYEVLDILKSVCAAKKVVGFDVVELSPRRDEVASEFSTAKLIYKIIGMLS